MPVFLINIIKFFLNLNAFFCKKQAFMSITEILKFFKPHFVISLSLIFFSFISKLLPLEPDLVKTIFQTSFLSGFFYCIFTGLIILIFAESFSLLRNKDVVMFLEILKTNELKRTYLRTVLLKNFSKEILKEISSSEKSNGILSEYYKEKYESLEKELAKIGYSLNNDLASFYHTEERLKIIRREKARLILKEKEILSELHANKSFKEIEKERMTEKIDIENT